MDIAEILVTGTVIASGLLYGIEKLPVMINTLLNRRKNNEGNI
jgi:hypothetical protein